MAGDGCLVGGGVKLEVLGGGGLRVVLGHSGRNGVWVQVRGGMEDSNE